MARSMLFKLCSRAPRTQTKPRGDFSAASRKRGSLVSTFAQTGQAERSSEDNDGHRSAQRSASSQPHPCGADQRAPEAATPPCQRAERSSCVAAPSWVTAPDCLRASPLLSARRFESARPHPARPAMSGKRSNRRTFRRERRAYRSGSWPDQLSPHSSERFASRCST